MNKVIWEQLYDLGTEYVNLAPWEFLRDQQMFEICLADGSKGWCSILGMAGELRGLIYYYGSEGMDSCLRMLNAWIYNRSGFSEAGQQSCLALFLGDSEEVGKEQKAIIRQLGRKYRGRGKWLYFESHRPHYLPACPNDEEAQVLAEMLKQLLRAIPAFQAKRISGKSGRQDKKKSGDGGMIYAYDPETDTLTERPLPEEYPLNEAGVVKDEKLFLLKSGARKKNRMTLEAGCYYTEDLVKDDDGKGYKPRLALLADHDSGMVIASHVLAAKDSSGQILTDLLTDWVIENGQPAKIYVPDGLYQKRLENLCFRLKMKVHVGDMRACSQFISSYISRNRPADEEIFPDLPEELRRDPAKMQAFLEDFMRALGLGEEDLEELLVRKAFSEEDWDSEALSGEDWEDEECEDDWEVDDEDMFDDFFWMPFSSRREKEEAVREFFEGLKDGAYDGYERYFCFDWSESSWQDLLMEGKKPLLVSQAQACKTAADKRSTKETLAFSIVQKYAAVMKRGRKKYLQDLLGDDVAELLMYIRKIIRKQDEQIDLMFIDPEDFRFSMDTVLKALEWGIIDVFYAEDDETVCLKCGLAEELTE